MTESNMQPSDRDLLIRIDERTKTMKAGMADMQENLEDNYVSQSEFKPVKLVVWVIVAAAIGALVVLPSTEWGVPSSAIAREGDK